MSDVSSNSYKYDAFIAHSSKDRDIVERILGQIEESGEFRCCYSRRDAVAGLSISNFMDDAVKHSRKTIAFISRDFIESSYCKKERELALNKAMRTGEDVLIPLLLDDFAFKNLPQSLEGITHLRIGQQNFLPRLLTALEESPSMIKNDEELRKENTQLKTINKQQKKHMASQQNQLHTQMKQIQQMEKNISKQETNLKQCQETLENLWDTQKQQNQQLEDKTSTLESRRGTDQNELNALKQQVEQLKAKNSALERDLKSCQEALQNQLDTQKQQNQQLKDKISTLESRRGTDQNESNALKQQVEQLKAKNSALERKLREWQDVIDEIEKYSKYTLGGAVLGTALSSLGGGILHWLGYMGSVTLSTFAGGGLVVGGLLGMGLCWYFSVDDKIKNYMQYTLGGAALGSLGGGILHWLGYMGSVTLSTFAGGGLVVGGLLGMGLCWYFSGGDTKSKPEVKANISVDNTDPTYDVNITLDQGENYNTEISGKKLVRQVLG